MKPNWKDAPPWARWMALDRDGQWHWYNVPPEIDEYKNEWVAPNCRYEKCVINKWEQSLEERPE